MEDKKTSGIKSWSAEDRPREKLLELGRNALTDVELLAILLASGTKNKTAVDVAREVLVSQNNSLDQLGRCSIKQLCLHDGIGPAKAITVVAALELGRRRKRSEVQQQKITSSRSAFDYIYPHLADLDQEHFCILALNRANNVLTVKNVSSGGLAGTIVDLKVVFKKAFEVDGVAAIICAHNHPSGSLRPSQADIELTKKLVAGGKILDIPVLDHLIIGQEAYYSFADDGHIS